MLHIISTIIVVALVVGLSLRRRRNIHPKIMFSAFVADLLLVLYIEFTRGAVERVVSGVDLLLWFHVSVSVATLVFYVVLIILGRQLLNGREEKRALHRKLAIIFCVLRSVNYVTSFMV